MPCAKLVDAYRWHSAVYTPHVTSIRRDRLARSQREHSLTDRLLAIWQETAKSGSFLPGEPTLSGSLSASRPAVREALIRLEERGLVRRRHGADTIVNPAALDIRSRLDEQVETADVIRAMGREASLEVLDARLVALDDDGATAFGTGPGASALQTTKLWRADKVAVMLAVDVILLRSDADADADAADGAIPAGVDPADPVFVLADKHGHGPVEWEMVWPEAANLSEETAARLERPVGEAALTLELMGVGRSGRYAYRAQEYHVQGAFRHGLIRSISR
jgi:GntR family transcriptional regulator